MFGMILNSPVLASNNLRKKLHLISGQGFRFVFVAINYLQKDFFLDVRQGSEYVSVIHIRAGNPGTTSVCFFCRNC